MKVSVIIPTRNRYRDLNECINSLLSMNIKPHEIIIVDSFSTDGTERLKDIYPIRYFLIKQKNRQIARNIGISVAKGDIIAFLDDDVVVDRRWLEYLLKPYSDDRVGGVGGRVIPYGERENYYLPIKHSDVGRVRKDGIVLGNFDAPLPEPIEVDTLQGCNMSFRREALINVGAFDENFKGNYFRDDTDLCLRIKRLGYKIIYQPKALVWHKHLGRVIDEAWIYWYIRNNTYFYFKNIFSEAMRYLLLFFLRQLLPPRDYVKKSGVKVKPSAMLPIIVLKGFVNGLLAFTATRRIS